MGVLCGLALVLASRAVVVTPVANMHSRPAPDADVVSQARCAQAVQIAEQAEGWVKIQTPDEYTGWIRASDVRELKAEEGPYASSGKVAFVESLFAHLFSEPSSTRHAPLLTVPFETLLEVAGEESNDSGKWLSLRLPDERQAWIRRGDVSLYPQALSVGEVVRLARQFQGLPYTWGGTTAFGFDCSGYTQMLCRRGGINIPRDAAPQFHWSGMKPVERTSIEPGDLLFFGQNPEKPNHVGMYLGDGDFIHSTTWERPVLQISRLADERWTRLFLGARRWKP